MRSAASRPPRIGLRRQPLIAIVIASTLLTLVAASATEEKALPASSVVMPQGEMTATALLAELRKTGNDVAFRAGAVYGDQNPTLRVPTERLELWPFLDRLAVQERLRISVEGRTADVEPRLLITRLGATARLAEPPTAYSGPFRLVLRDANRHRRYDQDLPSQLCLGFELAFEPRIDPLFLEVEDLKAQCGARQLRAEQRGSGPLRLRGLGQVEFQEVLPLPAEPLNRLDRLEGTLAIRTPTQTVALTAGLAAGEEARHEGIRLRVLAVEPQPTTRSLAIRLSLSYPPGQFALESHQGWAFADLPLALIDRADGPALRTERFASDVDLGSDDEIRLKYTIRSWSPPLPPRLRVLVPALPMTYRFPFAFEQVPLP